MFFKTLDEIGTVALTVDVRVNRDSCGGVLSAPPTSSTNGPDAVFNIVKSSSRKLLPRRGLLFAMYVELPSVPSVSIGCDMA